MQAYRDQYASLFRGGQDVVLIGISNDTPEDLRSWMKDDDFQFLFASDVSGQTYQAFGGNLRASQTADRRSVIVVGPDGRIAHVIPAFNQVDPAAYQELADAIDRVTP
jgi:thioredoxin-dependent peroxiredoxin